MLYPIELDPALADLPFIIDVAGDGFVMTRIDTTGSGWSAEYEAVWKDDGR